MPHDSAHLAFTSAIVFDGSKSNSKLAAPLGLNVKCKDIPKTFPIFMASSQTTASYPKQGPGPDLRKFMEKRMELKLNGGRIVTGVLRGYDQFMNIVLDQATEVRSPTEKHEIGMIVIRGNSIHMWECLDKIK